MDILNAVITSKISTDQILEWLTKDNSQNASFLDIIQTCTTKAEFTIFFLDYVKKQCQSILELSTTVVNKEDSQKKGDSFNQLSTSKTEVHVKKRNACILSPNHKNNSFDGSFVDTSISNQNIGSALTSTPVKSYAATFETSPIVLNTSNQDSSHLLNQSFNPSDYSTALSNQSQFSDSSRQNVSLYESFISNSSMTSNVGIYSPTSSLHDANTPQKSNSNSVVKKKYTSKSNHSVCLADFLHFNAVDPPKNNGKKTKSNRRIKPTPLKTNDNEENQQLEVFGTVNRPPIVNPQFAEVQPEEKSNEKETFETERKLLKNLKKKKKLQKNVLDKKSICPNRPILSTINTVPNVELVDNVEVLNIIVNLYSGLLRRNLVPNLMTELYFLISLITSQYKYRSIRRTVKNINDSKSNDLICQDSFEALKINLGCSDINEEIDTPKSFQEMSNLSINNLNNLEEKENQEKQSKTMSETMLFLDTDYNVVFFATATLYEVKTFLEILDRTTLKLLADNRLVESFQPQLQSYLNELYNNKYLQSKQIESTGKSNTLQTNVCFEVDTDSQINFISVTSFSMFRKQRDLFYEIIKYWEDRYASPKWSSALWEKKILTMINMYYDSVNYYHLARLFKQQLLMSSNENEQPEQPINEKYSSILENMQHLDPNKLNQLEKRLTTPVTSKSLDPVPPPSFPGVQKLYHDFLSVVTNQNFLTILEHTFIQEITEINETQFTCSEIEHGENVEEENTKQAYLLSVSNLRLMAKFLGLLISKPYQSKINIVHIISTQIAIRSQIFPPLDLQKYLNDALRQGKLTFTIPWIVQYLAMLDPIAFRLPHYLKVCEILYYIYRTVHDFMNPKAALLITFSIGWLFELPSFPKDLFYSWYTNYDINKILIFSETIDKIRKNQSIVNSSLEEQTFILDKMKIIDDKVLYTFCPFLEAFKALLSSRNSYFNTNNTVNRHITPVSSQLSEPSSATKAKMLQMQLQDAFFHSHPKSVKKTVDFVSERVAPSCIKYICQFVIPKNEEKCYEIMKSRDNIMNMVEKQDRIVQITTSIKDQCQEEMKIMTQRKIKNAIESLLDDDLLPAVKNMCVKIAQKMTMKRINQWLDFYISNMTTSERIQEKYSNYSLQKNSENEANDSLWKIDGESYDPQAPPATSVLEELRKALWEVIEQHGKWMILSEDQNLKIVQKLRATLYNREDALPSVKTVIYKMSIDYAIHLIVFKPELLTPKVEDKFIELWKLYSNARDMFHNPLCTRNIILLTQTYDQTVWPRYGRFIGRLLTEDLLNWDKFCEQCVAILRHEWLTTVFQKIPICLMETLNSLKSGNIQTEKIKSMIEWIAETCSGLNSNSF